MYVQIFVKRTHNAQPTCMVGIIQAIHGKVLVKPIIIKRQVWVMVTLSGPATMHIHLMRLDISHPNKVFAREIIQELPTHGKELVKNNANKIAMMTNNVRLSYMHHTILVMGFKVNVKLITQICMQLMVTSNGNASFLKDLPNNTKVIKVYVKTRKRKKLS